MIKIPTNGGNAVVWKMDADGEMEFTTAKDVKMGDRIEVRGRFLPIVEITQDNIVVSEAGAINEATALSLLREAEQAQPVPETPLRRGTLITGGSEHETKKERLSGFGDAWKDIGFCRRSQD